MECAFFFLLSRDLFSRTVSVFFLLTHAHICCFCLFRGTFCEDPTKQTHFLKSLKTPSRAARDSIIVSAYILNTVKSCQSRPCFSQFSKDQISIALREKHKTLCHHTNPAPLLYRK